MRFSIYFFSSSYFLCAYIFSFDSPASFLTSSPILALSSGQRSASLALEDDDLWRLCNFSGYGFFFLVVDLVWFRLDLLLVSVAEGIYCYCYICLPLPLFLELARLLLEVTSWDFLRSHFWKYSLLLLLVGRTRPTIPLLNLRHYMWRNSLSLRWLRIPRICWVWFR